MDAAKALLEWWISDEAITAFVKAVPAVGPYHLEEGNDLEYLRLLLSHVERRKAMGEIERCFAEWEKREYTQLVIEDKVREIFGLFRRQNMLEESVEVCGYYMDEAFYYAENMKRITESILQILVKTATMK